MAKAANLTLKTGSRNKAKVAIANRLARAIYHIIKSTDIRYKDIGPQRVNSEEAQINNLIRQLKKKGLEVDYQVTKKIVTAKRTQTVNV